MYTYPGLRIIKGIAQFFLLLGLITLFITVLVASRAFVFSNAMLVSNYSQRFSLEDVNKKVLELDTSPGLNTEVTIEAAKSIKAEWKSDDLVFVIQDPDAMVELVRIDLKKNTFWGEGIGMTTGDKLKELAEVKFNFTLPADMEIGRRLSGKLSGTITYPYSSGANTFRNGTKEMDLPILIRIVTRDEVAKSQRSFMVEAFKILGLMTIGFILIPAPIVYLINRKLKGN